MLADLARVVAEVTLALALLGGLERIEIRGQRSLCVDDHVLAAGNADDEIRTQESVLRGLRRLRDVVAVLDHPGVLHDVAQLRLSPAPAHVRGAQGVGQAPRALGEGRHLRAQRAVRLLADSLHALELSDPSARASP